MDTEVRTQTSDSDTGGPKCDANSEHRDGDRACVDGTVATAEAVESVEIADCCDESCRVQPGDRHPRPADGRCVEEAAERHLAAVEDGGERVEDSGAEVHACANTRRVEVFALEREPGDGHCDRGEDVAAAPVEPRRLDDAAAKRDDDRAGGKRCAVVGGIGLEHVRRRDDGGDDSEHKRGRDLDAP